MQHLTTSFDRAALGRRGAIAQVVGDTPLLELSRSGEGRVLLKHEQYNPSGSFFDRVALHVLAGRRPGEIVGIEGDDAFALSMATLGSTLGVSVEVIPRQAQAGRLRSLLARAGARIVTGDADEVRARWTEEGVEEVQRDASEPLLRALAEVAAEVAALGVQPAVWVLADFGLPPTEVQAALQMGHEAPYLELIADDHEAKRTLDGPAAARRSQVGQREGMLLSPLGAEIVEAAVNVAHEIEGRVVALVPEGGQRYLGWW